MSSLAARQISAI